MDPKPTTPKTLEEFLKLMRGIEFSRNYVYNIQTGTYRRT